METIFTRSEIDTTDLILGISEPFNSLTHLISENNCLSTIYAPLLIFIRNVLQKVDNKVIVLGETTSRLDDAVFVVDRYLQNIKENYNVFLTCLMFSPLPEAYANFFKSHFKKDLDMPGRLGNLVFAVGRIEHSPKEETTVAENKLNYWFQLLCRGRSTYNYANKACSETDFKTEIMYVITEEHFEYTVFVGELIDDDFKKYIRGNNIKEEKCAKGSTYYDCPDQGKYLISNTKLFLIKTEILFHIHNIYRIDTNSLSTSCNDHIFFTCGHGLFIVFLSNIC